MELPALVLMPVIVLISPVQKNEIIILILSLWILHYFYRTILFPIKLKTKGKKMPVVIVISAFIFNLFNGFFVGYEIGNISQLDFGINTLIGLIIFFTGMYINRSSDNKLISLRKENKEYQIPQGGMFKYISCPNHFGEIIEWFGFAIIVFNLGALSFAFWTAFNLIPRAMNHHNWYKKYFEEYPTNRKAVIPYIF
jgi:steroid 5-alpha reductase family enzyme